MNKEELENKYKMILKLEPNERKRVIYELKKYKPDYAKGILQEWELSENIVCKLSSS